MVSMLEAYEVFKQMHSEPPMLMFSETPHYYKSDIYVKDKGFTVIRKDSGEIEYRAPLDLIDMLLREDINFEEKEVYLPQLYDDIIEYYLTHKSEKLLARLYLRASHEVSDNNFDAFATITYKSKSDYDKIKSRWESIERFLYSEIRTLMDNDKEIVYPPCVLNKWDDPFYRIKPFMVRNGYTDSSKAKRWEEIKQ
ncbi:hypothetical protein [Butyrivibrio sp. VCB2001]|uniref:hypothetical protein n=1 Tax=Butyrivibrio sp. VCB2001 TaxID=1280667 RepID=UPI00047A6A52|nr:hypothetical protein [Butyrivibrio sp. VCB2001]